LKLSDYRFVQTQANAAARPSNAAVGLLRGVIGEDDDPVAFSIVRWPTDDEPRICVSLVAATAIGLAAVDASAIPASFADPTATLWMTPWSQVGHVELTATVADERVTAILTVGDIRLEPPTYRDTAAMVELYAECVRHLAGGRTQ
jgi:hypothetical protein